MSRKILLAEDDSDDQGFFYDFLHAREDVVLFPPVENGEILFEVLENAARTADLPDAIILDQNMPKLNGLQTLKMLKQHSRYSHIPVMIYSTYANEILVEQSMAFGATLVASKPSDQQGYHEMMDEFLKAIS